MPVVNTPYELGQARKAARKIVDWTPCEKCENDPDVPGFVQVSLEEGSRCPRCDTPVNWKLAKMHGIIESNAEMALDQHQSYPSIEDAFWSHVDNVSDALAEEGLKEFILHWPLSVFIAYFAQEADRQGIKVPDVLLGIERARR